MSQINKNRPKLLGMSDSSLRTGFGGILAHILDGASSEYDPYLLGWGFKYEEPIKRGGHTLLPVGTDYYGTDVSGPVLQALQPEIFITTSDTRMIEYLPDLLKHLPNKPTWIYYPVIDGHVWQLDNKETKWPSNWTAFMKQADVVVAMSNFGAKILEANGITPAATIYHGVDTTMFRPLLPEQKENIKTQLGIKGKFVIGGVFKNIVRKNPEKYLQAFCIFRQGKEDKVVLLLHTSPQPAGSGEFDLVQQAVDLGLVVGKDVFFTQQNLPTQLMPQIYNAFDVFWCLGGMESYCVPLAEAMSCGISVVALEGTTFPEILGGTGILSPVPKYEDSHGCHVTYGSYNGVEGLACNPYDVAKKTEQLYQDKALRERIGFKEVERAITCFDWSVVTPQWNALFKKYTVTLNDLPAEWKQALGGT